MASLLGNFIEKVAPTSRLSQNVFVPAPKFQPSRDIPDLAGKVVLVTGGNVGIGYSTVQALLEKNATVYLAARSESKAEEAIEKLKRETGKTAIFLQLDLADLNKIKEAADVFLGKQEKLDILFNNAGVMVPPPDQLTTQGYDLQFGTNTLGHYYFTMLLLPAMKRSTETQGNKARVVNTSSAAHYLAPGDGIAWDALKAGTERDAQLKKWGSDSVLNVKIGRWRLYGVSKMGNIVFTHILNKYYGDSVAAYALHPGSIKSDLQRHMPIAQKFSSIFLSSPDMGALSQLWAGTASEAENHIGAYLVPWARLGSPDTRSASETFRDKLKAWLEKQVQDFESLAV